MKSKYRVDIFFGIALGIFICVTDLLYSEMVYFDVASEPFCFLNYVFGLLGSAVVIVTLLYKKPSILSMIIRFGVFVMTFCSFFFLLSTSGFIAYIEHLLNINGGSATDNVSGLMFLLYVIMMAGISTVTIIIKVTVVWLQSRLKK